MVDRQGHHRQIRQDGAVVSAVGEGHHAAEGWVRRVGEPAVQVQDQRAGHDVVDQDRLERVPIGVGVVVQDARCRDRQHLIRVGDVGIVAGDRRRVDDRDAH